MANTKIPVELSSTPGIVDGSNATAITIDSSENVLVGSGTSNGISGSTTGLQVAGAGFAGMISATRHDNNAYASALMLGKSRNTTVGSNTIVQSGDEIGAIGFFADDGTNLDSQVAYIRALVDGTPGANDTPGRLTFSTTADGSAAATERMRIDSSGNVGIGTTSPTRPLTVAGSMNLTGTGTYIFGGDNEILAGQDSGGYYFATGNQQDVNKTIYIGDNASSINFHTGNSERMRIDSSGNVGIADTSPAYRLELPNTGDSTGQVRASGFITYSDGRLKTNRTDLDYGLNVIKQLEPLKYFHKSSTKDEDGAYVPLEEGNQDIGFVAQDVLSLIPEIVGVPENPETDLYSLNYAKLTPVLVKAIQEQQEQIEALQSEINTLKGGD
jgi:hypothetical protein